MQRIIDEQVAPTAFGTVVQDRKVNVSSSGDVASDFNMVAKGNAAHVMGQWKNYIGRTITQQQLPSEINLTDLYVQPPNTNIQPSDTVEDKKINVPTAEKAFSVLSQNLTNKTNNVYEASFRVGQSVGSARMTMQSISVNIALNPKLIKLSSMGIADLIEVVPPDNLNEENASTSIWFRKIFAALGKVQITVQALAEKCGQWGFIPDDDDTMAKIFPQWNAIKEYILAVQKCKQAGINHFLFYAPEIKASINGSYENCTNFCSNSYVGYISEDALGTLNWFKDFWVKPVDGSNDYEYHRSPITGQKIPYNFLITADSVSGTGFNFSREIIMKGGHWDTNLYPKLS